MEITEKKVIVKSLAEYIDIVVSIAEPKVEVGCYQKKLVYRGLSWTEYELIPSILRYPSEQILNSLLSKELDLIEQAQLRFPNAYSTDYPVLRLAKMQHYGIPTRMMDVTANALVALYFACQNSKDNPNAPGEVVVFSDYIYSAFAPTPNAIADTTSLCVNNLITHVRNLYYRLRRRPYFLRVEYPDDSENMDAVINRVCEAMKKPIIVDVGNITERQNYQQGKFIIFPNRISNFDDGPHIMTDLVKLKKDSDMIVKRIIVDKDKKDNILLDLQRCGITRDFLFSDSMDIVNTEITEQVKRLYTCKDW